jgi:ABC-2 type transport system permease protein
MRLYVEVARRTYARASTYRSATIAGLFTNTVFGFLLAYVLLGVYAQRPEVGTFDTTDTLTFIFVSQGLLTPLGLFATTEIADRITTGDVVVDLQRPYDHQGWWAAVMYGQAGFYAIFRGIPPFLVGAIAFDLQLPSVANLAAFLVALVLAVGVSFGWRYLLQMSAFWIVDVRGPNQLGMLAAHFLCGAYIPIVFFPDWLEGLCRILPFAYMVQVPIEIWLGQHTGADLLAVFAVQLLWLGALVGLGRLVLARAVHRVVVQGG